MMKKIEKIENYLTVFLKQPVVLMSSARVGLYEVLKFLKFSRQDNILVPDFLCQSVLNIINMSGFPVKKVDENTKAVLVYHQWGYPQKMDEVMKKAKELNLLVIEDCVNSFDSKYKGKNIGTFGDAALYSFFKCFSTYAGGVLSSSNNRLLEFVRLELKSANSFWNGIFNRLAFKVVEKNLREGKMGFWLDIIYMKSVHFPILSRQMVKRLPVDILNFRALLQERKNKYMFIKTNIKSDYLLVDGDKDSEVNPLYVPIFLPIEKLELARERLKTDNINLDILHFDVNRNVFDSRYEKCLAIPCLYQVKMPTLEKICHIINEI